MGSVLRPLKERAEHILKDMEERTTTGLAALDLLAALAREKESAVRSRKDSGLSPRAFGVYWAFKDDSDLHAAGVNAMDLAGESESLSGAFPTPLSAPTKNGGCGRPCTGRSWYSRRTDGARQ